MSATVTAEKSSAGTRILFSHLEAVVAGLEKLDDVDLPDIGREVAEGCTISTAIRGAVETTNEIRSAEPSV